MSWEWSCEQPNQQKLKHHAVAVDMSEQYHTGYRPRAPEDLCGICRNCGAAATPPRGKTAILGSRTCLHANQEMGIPNSTMSSKNLTRCGCYSRFNAMSGYVMSAGLSSSPYIATDNEPHLVLTWCSWRNHAVIITSKWERLGSETTHKSEELRAN